MSSSEPVSWTRSCKVGMGCFNPTILRHQEVHKKKFAIKTSMPATTLMFYSCKISSIDLARIPLVSHHRKQKISYGSKQKRSQDLIYEEQNLHTLEDLHNGYVQVGTVLIVVEVVVLSPSSWVAIRFDPTLQRVAPPRCAHVQHYNDSSFLVHQV
jgi:hypothetical protein